MENGKCGVCGKDCLGTLETCGNITCEQVLRSLAYARDKKLVPKPAWDRAQVLLEMMFGGKGG